MRIRLYTDGFARYFFGVLLCVSLFWVIQMILLLLVQIKLEYFLGFIIFSWLSSYLLIYLISNRIELNKSELKAIFVKQDYARRFFPAIESRIIPISSIQKIVLGRADTLGVKKDISGLWGKALLITEIAEPFVPLICILTEGTKCFYIETKPFSKSGISKLFDGFSQLQIETQIEEGLL